MKNLKRISFIALTALLLCSCASVKFFSDSGLKHKTGIRVFTARPYILCDQTSGKEKVSVIWLPDLLNPSYLLFKPGFGSSELKIAIENGSLSSFGITTDAGLPEVLNSLASVISKSASVAGMLSASPVTQGSDAAPSFDLYEIDVENDSTILRRISISGENPF